MTDFNSVELFTGGGGLAIGLEQAGFSHDLLVERNLNAAATIEKNRIEHPDKFGHWELKTGDVHGIDFRHLKEQVSLVAGGPPCQPFSLGGKHRGSNDSRDLFPEAVRTVAEIRPKAFVFENVRGLLRPAFSTYFEYVLLQLQYPMLNRLDGESINEHLSRLERVHTSDTDVDLSYNVVFRCLNAADFGVPQRRDRVFIVGFRSDIGIEWSFPEETHGNDELIWQKWVTGEYWDRHGIPRQLRGEPTIPEQRRISRLQKTGFVPQLLPWVTVRDALSDLPDPLDSSADVGVTNHEFRPGARSYPGHTGSALDEPAKTLKAGDHGVPGGENMMRRDDGSVRYFTVRESARLQTFPDDYTFLGSWTEAMRQIGNAVPVTLARAVGSSVIELMNSTLVLT